MRWRRSRADRWLGGVCGGLAPATGLPAWLWRLTFLLLALCGGTGLVLYVLLWILLPKEDSGLDRGAGSSSVRPGPRHENPVRAGAVVPRCSCSAGRCALAALVLWPLVWLMTLPLRLIGIAFEARVRGAARCCSCRRGCFGARR